MSTLLLISPMLWFQVGRLSGMNDDRFIWMLLVATVVFICGMVEQHFLNKIGKR